jgi:hypothetical protein
MMNVAEMEAHFDQTRHVRFTPLTPYLWRCEECADISREPSVEFCAG